MQQQKKFQLDGFWLVTIASIIWGTIGVATQAIYNIDDTSPMFINLVRVLIATPILLVIGWRMLGRQLFVVKRRRDLYLMMFMGTCLVCSQVAYFAGIQYSNVTIATLLTLCIPPLLVVVLSVMLKLETFNRQIIIALMFAMVGSALLVGTEPSDSMMTDLWLGTVYSLLSAIFYALMLICGRFLASDYHPVQVTAIGFSAGTVVLLLLNMLAGITVIQTSQGWMLVAYLGLIPTALAYVIFQVGLRSVSATTASIVIMLDPLVAAGLAWGLLGETLTPIGIVGALALMVSLFLLSIERR